MLKVASEFVGVTLFERYANGIPERFFGSCRGLAQDGLEFGEDLLDRIEVRAVGWKKTYFSPSCLDLFQRCRALVA